MKNKERGKQMEENNKSTSVTESNEGKSETKNGSNLVIIKEKKSSLIKIIAVVILAALLIVLTVNVVKCSNGKKNNEVKVTTVSDLRKIINVKELSTFSAVCNAVVRRKNAENPDSVDYYVSYNSKVKLGINMDGIDVTIVDSADGSSSSKIVIIIPEAEILELSVDMKSLDYIFEDKSFNKQSISGEAYKLCEDDVRKRVEENGKIKESAEENAVNTITALVKPFLEQLDRKYDLEVKVGGKS